MSAFKDYLVFIIKNGTVTTPYKVVVQMTYYEKSLETINHVNMWWVWPVGWKDRGPGGQTGGGGLLCLRAHTALGLLRPPVNKTPVGHFLQGFT